MLRLTADQLKVFAAVQEATFINRLSKRLTERFTAELSSQGIALEGLEAFIRRGIVEAESMGVVLEDDVALYIEFMLILHPGFSRLPEFSWAHEILRHKDITGTEKMDRIHDYYIFVLAGRS